MMTEPDFSIPGGGCLVHGHIYGAAGKLSMSNASILVTLPALQPPQNSALSCSVQVSFVKKGNTAVFMQCVQLILTRELLSANLSCVFQNCFIINNKIYEVCCILP